MRGPRLHKWWERGGRVSGDSIGTGMGTLVAQIWGLYWHRYGDLGGTGVETLVGQVWGFYWHRYGDPGGIDMETLVAQIRGCWWLSWWDSVGTDLGSLLAQIWGTWWDRCGDSDGTAGGTLVARLWGHWWPSRSSPPLQKHNFPIDYTLRVQHEEVLRTANVTRLVSSRRGHSVTVGGQGGEVGVCGHRGLTHHHHHPLSHSVMGRCRRRRCATCGSTPAPRRCCTSSRCCRRSTRPVGTHRS